MTPYLPGRRAPGLVAVLLLLPVFATVALVTAAPAAACSCAVASAQDAAERADVVFSGTLIDRDVGGTGRSSDDPVTLTFEVDRVHKGAAARVQDVVTVVDSASCGWQPEGAGPVVVFATGEPLGTDLCSGNVAAGSVEGVAAVAYLGAGTAPVEVTATQAWPAFVWWSVGVGVAALLVVALWRFRRLVRSRH